MSEAHISHKDVLRRANAAVEQGDHTGFFEHCTEDTVWTFLGDRTLQGKAAVRQWMDESYKVAPPQLRVHRLVAEGDVLTAVGEIVLTEPAGRSRSMRTATSGACATANWRRCTRSWSRPGKTSPGWRPSAPDAL